MDPFGQRDGSQDAKVCEASIPGCGETSEVPTLYLSPEVDLSFDAWLAKLVDYGSRRLDDYCSRHYCSLRLRYRGGEFLVYPGSRRGVLKFEDVFTAPTASGQSVHVQIRQPKNMWWLFYALAQCFDPGGADLNFGPVVALVNYHKYSGVPFSPEGPAFVMACGAPLDRDFFVERISALLCMANIEFRDSEGNLAKVLATSCRAGGVRSALDAKIDVATIQLLGRWRSMAWSSYALHSISSLQTARQQMWQTSPTDPSAPLGVGWSIQPPVFQLMRIQAAWFEISCHFAVRSLPPWL